jgi:hypothetical protein
MLVFVTEDTGLFRMFGIGPVEGIINALMTAGALLGRHVCAISDGTGLMGGVTYLAVFIHHVRRMGLMAFQTFRYLSMGLMACRTEQL